MYKRTRMLLLFLLLLFEYYGRGGNFVVVSMEEKINFPSNCCLND